MSKAYNKLGVPVTSPSSASVRVPMAEPTLITALCGPSHGNFVGFIALKPLLNTLVFTLLYVKIPIQQILWPHSHRAYYVA